MAEHPAVNRRVVSSSLTCGAKIGRRSSGLTLAAFSFCQAVFVTARISNGWRPPLFSARPRPPSALTQRSNLNPCPTRASHSRDLLVDQSLVRGHTVPCVRLRERQ